MGLMKFLAVGRSIGRFGNDRSPFKMTQQSLLPKFGSVNAPEELARGSGETRNQATVVQGPSRTEGPRASAATEGKSMNGISIDAPVPAKAAAAPKHVEPSRPAFPRGRWTIFRNPFAQAAKTPATVAAPVQAELSLDLVKPVRNDLSDADLELVQAQALKTPAASATPIVAPNAAPAPVAVDAPAANATDGVLWGRIKNEFLGAGKS